MFGFLLFSAVVLSAVDVGSSLTVSAKIQLNISSYPNWACQFERGAAPCMPHLYAVLAVTDNNRVLAANAEAPNISAQYDKILWDITFPDVVASGIQLPILLRVAATVNISCPGEPKDGNHDTGGPFCKNQSSSSHGSIVQLAKMPMASSSLPPRVETQLQFGEAKLDHFKWSAILTVKYDTSGISKGSECVDIGSDQDFCPTKLPFSCPIFSGPGFKNPCCEVNVESSCMLRNESNIKTTARVTTPTSTSTTSITTTKAAETDADSTTTAPTESPTTSRTESPTTSRTESPTTSPTESPTTSPTESPTTSRTESPSTAPTESPTTARTKGTTTARTKTTTTANVTATDCPKTQHDNVYYWLTIEFVLISIILLVGFIVLAVFYKRLKKKFEEGEGSDEGDPK